MFLGFFYRVHDCRCEVVVPSSNVNEVFRAVLNSLSFLQKDFARTKSTKSKKARRNQAKAQNAASEQK